jgi:hypothetical protein
VTPRVTNRLGSLDHMPANLEDSMEIKIQMKILKLKLMSSLVLMGLSRIF